MANSTTDLEQFEGLRDSIHRVLGALAALFLALSPILGFLTPLVKNISLLLGSTEAVGGGTIAAGGALAFGIVGGLAVGGLLGFFVLTPLADRFLDHIEADLYG